MSGVRGIFSVYVRTIVFGISDGIVSTVGLLVGIAITGATSHEIEVTGIIYAFVEAASMAVGAFLSEESAEEYAAGGAVRERLPIVAGAVMFLTFALSSLAALAPYLVLDAYAGSIVSIIISMVMLFIAGTLSASVGRASPLKHGVRAVVLGVLAIAVGLAIGSLYRS